MAKKGSCRECKYADGCTCMIDCKSVDNASNYTCDRYRPAKPLTNADLIRQMTDEELVEVLRCKCCDFNNNPECASIDCKEGHMIWLKQEVQEND